MCFNNNLLYRPQIQLNLTSIQEDFWLTNYNFPAIVVDGHEQGQETEIYRSRATLKKSHILFRRLSFST